MSPALEREVQCSRRSPSPPAPGAKARKNWALGAWRAENLLARTGRQRLRGLVGEKARGELMLGRRDRVLKGERGARCQIAGKDREIDTGRHHGQKRARRRGKETHTESQRHRERCA